MSGMFDLWHLGLGVVSSALVAYMSHDLLFQNRITKKNLKEAVRIIRYIPYLFYLIVLANLYIVYLSLHPNMKSIIDPHVIKFRTKLKKDLSIVTLANSITLTPGTITVLVEDGYFYVHAIDKVAAASLPGDMEREVKHIFEEK